MKIGNLLNVFSGFFIIMNENSQLNIIKGINKNLDGKTLLTVGPINSDNSFDMTPYQIIKNGVFIKQFNKADIKLIKSLLISEGDIFITSKKYLDTDEVLTLESILDRQTWALTREELEKNKDILSRLNNKYFSHDLNLK